MDIAINFVLLIIASALFFIVGFFVGRFLLDRVGTTKLLEAEERAVQILQEAQREAEAQKSRKA
jgi:ribonuclease Y